LITKLAKNDSKMTMIIRASSGFGQVVINIAQCKLGGLFDQDQGGTFE